jgi:hypothetical protein
MICGKEITTFGTGMDNCDETEFLEYAGFVSVEFGYGSEFDCEQYSGQIHDSCFKNVVKNNMRQIRDQQQFLDSIPKE